MHDQFQGNAQFDSSPTLRAVSAKVKWFNAAKGFGFVTLDQSGQDAFLPMAILRRAGHEDIREGTSLVCDIGPGAKGQLVTAIGEVDLTTATPDRRIGDPGPGRGGGTSMDGAVKWFEPGKGYGFIAPDDGGKDVFIHITALKRSGLAALEPGARVRIEVVTGKKGLEADRITII